MKWIMSKFSLIPNSIAFDLSYSLDHGTMTTSDSSKPYQINQVKTSPALAYLTRLSVRHISSSSVRPRWGFSFSFSPSYTLLYKKAHLTREGGGDLDDSYLTEPGIFAGIGPDAGIETPVGYFYIRFAFEGGWQYLSLKITGGNMSHSGLVFQVDAEYGWSFFISQNLNVRLFTGSRSIDEDFYKKAFAKTTPHEISDGKDIATRRYGVSLGYFFPQGRYWLKELIF